MISLLCPTRGRPENMTRLALTAHTTATHPASVQIVWFADDDDAPSHEVAWALRADGVDSTLVTGPRMTLSACWNECVPFARGDILGHFGDDIIFHTQGWDVMVEDAFAGVPDRIAFVHGRDGIHDARLGTHGFLHRRWVDAVGHFVPPYFSSDYNDTWLTEVADLIGRRVFLPELYTEHMHPAVGKAELDQTHRERIERGERDNVGALYASLAHERERDADRLRAVMG